MGIIHELPASVINQIAAGEVVERPASVVKELLENAIDAGASRVELTIERGGKDLVKVADDGNGMERDDVPLAFRPHATSKLKGSEDLFQVRTLGFRGEALAAIAEVSRVRCQTRPPEAAVGTELTIEGGRAGELKDCGGSPGTTIEVRNLFFNTPVRRTFLKSDSTESSHVSEMFTRIALANPTVHLTLRSGSRTLYDLPPSTGIKERVAKFLGQELADALLWVESQVENIHLWGYVAHPSQSRSSSKHQYLFVGGRYVRDRSLAHALGESYRGLLMVGRHPVAFLFLDLPAEEVDVNVHPTKIEVRFRDSHRIYSQLLTTVRQTFLGSDLHSRLQAPPAEESRKDAPNPAPAPSPVLDAGRAERQSVASWFEPSTGSRPPSKPLKFPENLGERPEPDWARSLPPSPQPRPHFDEFAGSETPSPEQPEPGAAPPQPSPQPPASFEARGAEPVLPERAIQVHDSYLIAETEDGMVVIDQHALHERILYEELKARVERGGVESQKLLVPEPVELGPVEAEELSQRREVLAKLGIGIEPFGGGTILVSSVPAMLRDVSVERLVRDLAEHFRGSTLDPSADALLEDVLNMVACKAAVKAGQKLSSEEVLALLSRRHLAANTHHCPHGRPTALVFTKAELERQFGRI